MADGVQALSDLTGMTRETVTKLWQEAQDNQKRLGSCVDHFFVKDLHRPGHHPARYRCTRCRGEIDGHAFRWYMLGRQHATSGVTPGVSAPLIDPPRG